MRNLALSVAAFGAATIVAGCAAFQAIAPDALQAGGVSATTAQTISADAALAGQLFCQTAQGLVAVTGANVLNAKAEKVATVCTAAEAGSTPVAPPSGTVAILVTVAGDVLAALNASKAGA